MRLTMAKNVEIIIDGVRHKLVKEKSDYTCFKCTLKRQCKQTGGVLCRCLCGSYNYVFNKVEE